MTAIMKGRWTAQPETGFVVFIIGMRINHWWMIHRWLPLILAMGRMIRELSLQPELGFLGGKSWFGRTIVLIQYWHSFEQLEAYAKAKDLEHLPAWADFNRKVGNDGTVGVYHETYRVRPGDYENVFVNMPPTLLGDCSTLIEAKGRLADAAGRMGRLTGARTTGTPVHGGTTTNNQSFRSPAADRISPMSPQHPETAEDLRSGVNTQTEASGKLRLFGHERKDVTDLAALVEKAIEMADASGLNLVGIELCSALERLRKMDEPPHLAGMRDC